MRLDIHDHSKCRLRPVTPRDIVLVPRINEFLESLKQQGDEMHNLAHQWLSDLQEKYPQAFMPEEEAQKLGLECGNKYLKKHATREEMIRLRRHNFESDYIHDKFWLELRLEHEDLFDSNTSMYLKQGQYGGISICRYNDAQDQEVVRELLALMDVEVPADKKPSDLLPKIIVAEPPREKRKEFFRIILKLKELESARHDYMDSDGV